MIRVCWALSFVLTPLGFIITSSSNNPVTGILIALCCHQLCRHYMYPYQEYLNETGITPKDFACMCAMSSWAICGRRLKNDEDGDNDHDYNDRDCVSEDDNIG